MEMFEVTFLGDDDSEATWRLQAPTPQEALRTALEQAEGREGTYSVWDSRDPHGMPLLERIVD